MKILIACNRTSSNPFVRTLADSLRELGVDVTCSLDEFWHSWDKYDVIHLQWPHLLVKGLETITPLKEHLQTIKSSGKTMVVTCHNLHPHYSQKMVADESYDLVYNMVDCIIHMGDYSFNLCKKKYPHAKHVIIPHHVYDALYKSIPSREDAMKHLYLNPKRRYVLCFGAFRHNDEREIAVKASRILGNINGKVLAPGFSKYRLQKNILRTIEEYIKNLTYRFKYKNLIISKGFVPDEDLPYYYAASDIALIHRREILNSGNLPMAFYMGKVVIGPNVGNVGAILNETGNPTFDINNIESIEDCIKKALILNKNGKGEENRKYAIKYYSSNIVAEQYKKLYKKLM